MNTKRDFLDLGLTIRAAEITLLNGYKARHFGGTVHTCIGQEITPALLALNLNCSPFVFSNHRGHGHFIAHTGSYVSLFREFLAKNNSPSKGLGGSQHLFESNFLSNGIQGNTAPFAVGVGAIKPSVIYLGDGTFGEGVLYEAMNLSHLAHSKILFVVEDNCISQTTPSQLVLSGSIQSKFEAFNIPVLTVDSADVNDYIDLSSKLNSIWLESPILGLIVKSYRLNSHSKGDDSRSQDTISNLKDPLKILADILELDFSTLLDDKLDQVKLVWKKVLEESDQEYKEIFRPVEKNVDTSWSLNNSHLRINEHIRDAIDDSLNDDALFIGEDIVTKWNEQDSPYGGAFGVSLNLSEKHKNVIGSSISEAGIVGLAAGYSFASQRLAIAEIMFADFSSLIVDQVFNGFDKFRKMFGCDFPLPLAVRLPYGMGRGYGPTHSQTPIELFSSLSETILISYTPFLDYNSILKSIQRARKPALIFEPKALYGDRVESWVEKTDGLKVEFINGELAPNILFKTDGLPKLRVISHGSLSKLALEELIKTNISFEMLVVTELYKADNMITFLSGNNAPILILEEKNSPFGPLAVVVNHINTYLKLNLNVIQCEHVSNIPSKTEWENQLMIDPVRVHQLISEAIAL